MHSSHIEFEYTVSYRSAVHWLLHGTVELFSYPNFFREYHFCLNRPSWNTSCLKGSKWNDSC
ncbi:hypothetical protein T01_15318 [Trichinella spiralis]|uniref:Uncharacterized protein n=1 Tax=Trichinella spiralis TaxID=6334 RepID=A0A0V0Z4A6_TRISP|nr:hypothetical protein T01_15318 [Trichinella spiralis]